jgi:nucleoside-diphosphate-sugar epimerase
VAVKNFESIFLTGATGCVGSYILKELLTHTTALIYVFVRDPTKLPHVMRQHERVRILVGTLETIEYFRYELSQSHVLIHAAVVWGGESTFVANVTAVSKIIACLDPARCRRIFYFSTASLLGADAVFTPRSFFAGTDYIRSKAAGCEVLQQSVLREKIYFLYPTVVIGGSKEYPWSAAGQGLVYLFDWVRWLRFLKIDGYLHWIHAQDIARLVVYWLEVTPPEQHLVLGNPAVSVNQLLSVFADYAGFHTKSLFSLRPHLFWLTRLLYFQMSDWDRYSLQHRFLTYSCWNPRTAGLEAGCEGLIDMLQLLGVNPRGYSTHSSSDL